MGNVMLLGVSVSIGKREELYSEVLKMRASGGAVATVNPEIMYLASENSEFSQALSESLCIPDGYGVATALLRLGYKTEVLPGVELGEKILSEGISRLAIVGGKAGVAERAMQNLVVSNRGVIPEFVLSGYGEVEREFDEKMQKHYRIRTTGKTKQDAR